MEATIKQVVSAGIVSGYPDSSFKPNRTVTRVEFAVMWAPSILAILKSLK
ncbi:S-layer homology domain-containing protein [Paenibacillus filicis]|uniref:S-layer homology domain-containing protein n=1 Tax=Paenibacillus gyeongsangnamensis TaxID=3388067 RepID=A0ABT4QM51_9BACL|nr:S-layer homology domain-containing protein [Paenibacillus filicis]MCZ8517821.1 S-layer homology domain-containing protein [Paenibacillus filicis]